MNTTDLKSDLLEIGIIKAPNGVSYIEIDNVKRYNSPFSLDNDYDLVYKLWLVEYLAAHGGTSQNIVPFSAATSKTINWQTDIFPGGTETYVQVMGNNIPRPVVDILPDLGSPNSYQRITANITYTLNDDGSINTFTIDWSTTQTGNIIF
jgi:hypothetical protein